MYISDIHVCTNNTLVLYLFIIKYNNCCSCLNLPKFQFHDDAVEIIDITRYFYLGISIISMPAFIDISMYIPNFNQIC